MGDIIQFNTGAFRDLDMEEFIGDVRRLMDGNKAIAIVGVDDNGDSLVLTNRKDIGIGLARLVRGVENVTDYMNDMEDGG